jgi:SAM-dependent methyltransferase
LKAAAVRAARAATMHAGSDAQLSDIYAATERYYSRKALVYGPTPAGVDWPSAETQELRIAQLLKGFGLDATCSLNDVGCGYGATLDAIAKFYPTTKLDYIGIDLSAEMVRLAQVRWSGRTDAAFMVANVSPRIADYSIASGIFNVKLECKRERWEELVRRTLRQLCDTSRIGFAVNFLFHDGEPGIPELYWTRPEPWVEYCKSQCESDVDVVSGYGPPEFTLTAVKSSAKSSAIQGRKPSPFPRQ